MDYIGKKSDKFHCSRTGQRYPVKYLLDLYSIDGYLNESTFNECTKTLTQIDFGTAECSNSIASSLIHIKMSDK